MPSLPISRRHVLGLSAVTAAAVATAATTVAATATASEPKESKDVQPMVVECLADMNGRSS